MGSWGQSGDGFERHVRAGELAVLCLRTWAPGRRDSEAGAAGPSEDARTLCSVQGFCRPGDSL